MTTLRAVSEPLAQEPFYLNPLPPSEQKRRTSLVILMLTLAFMLIGILTCVALVGTASKAVNDNTKASTQASQSQQAQDLTDASREVMPGKAFKLGKHKMLTGWKVEQDASLGDAMFGVTGKVKNISDDTLTASIHFKIIDKSGEVLGSVQCNSADLKPGQTQALNCIPDGKYGKYKTVTVESNS